MKSKVIGAYWLLGGISGSQVRWKCSKCGSEVRRLPNEKHYPFCPYCGRGMSEKKRIDPNV